MAWILFLLQSLLLFHIFLQDRANRQVYLLSYIALGVLLFVGSIRRDFYFFDLGVNLGIIATLSLSIYGFILFKERQIVNPFKNHIGIGDFLFVTCLGLGLAPFELVFFLTMGSISILVFYTLKSKLFNYKVSNIPLAGDLSLLLIVYTSLSLFEVINLEIGGGL